MLLYLLTSRCIGMALISLATFSSLALFLPVIHTIAPLPTKSIAVAFPIPELPPVISTFFPRQR